MLILQNRFFLSALIAWFIAQFLKILITLITTKKLNFKRFIGSGGMPSSHSAFVTSLAMSIGKVEGWDTPVTALSVAFALVVMYDAAGVRQAAGKQAKVLNKIIDEIIHHKTGLKEERLKELVGHTPIEVIIGALLGIVTASLFV
ncbi:MAG: uncharacterized protein PWP21_205 [Thermosediminibacterales bacterium]|nr:uncharacterized protein [Thermosediminibacterales bacterium]